MNTFHQQFNTTGNAAVGVQIGQLSGDLHQGAGVLVGVAADLDRLRTALSRAHQRGEIDTATLDGARQELDVAGAALPATDDERRGQVRRALHNLFGLLAGVAGFGAQIAAIVSAVEGHGA
ncbi:hypothetical protein [Actinoplanes sp. L3-i22]|uniref:hypothetical protein n=1 Tax=Actinoplanes sp. L3-i22 TaxID=2836373 RepID=UPI001C74C9C3|nr:hypothetical protein [Actinoplanes sp. L3-i22]BCY08422.1 hypothetical protein L3i22_035100 [Actinoplanes sp. L3-i22]